MSDTELRFGTATPVDVPEELESFTLQVAYLIEIGYDIEEWDEGWVCCDNLEYVDGRWFEISDERHCPAYDLVRAVKQADGSYDYVCMWYNGGAGFSEVLEEAIRGAE